MKFVKKTTPQEAVKVVKENETALLKLLQEGVTPFDIITEGNEIVGFHIHSWEGVDPVFYDFSKNKNGGDKPYWVIKGLKNETYPCVADDNEDAPLGYTTALPKTITFARNGDSKKRTVTVTGAIEDIAALYEALSCQGIVSAEFELDEVLAHEQH